MKALLLLKVPLLSTLLVFSIAVLVQISVRPGIILMLLLDSILSSKAKRAGQVVAARLVQNSPLAEGFTSKTGITIVGHTIELNAPADAAGATTVYRFDEFTAYKKHSTIPISSRSVHSSKNAVAVQAFPKATALPKRPRPQTQSCAAQGPSRNIYSAGSLAITPTA